MHRVLFSFSQGNKFVFSLKAQTEADSGGVSSSVLAYLAGTEQSAGGPG